MAGDYTVMSSNVTDHFMQFTSLGKIYSMEFFPVEKGKIMYVMTRQYLKISLVNYSDMLVWDEQKVKIGILGSFQVSFPQPKCLSVGNRTVFIFISEKHLRFIIKFRTFFRKMVRFGLIFIRFSLNV
jgi:hypothetical protein